MQRLSEKRRNLSLVGYDVYRFGQQVIRFSRQKAQSSNCSGCPANTPKKFKLPSKKKALNHKDKANGKIGPCWYTWGENDLKISNERNFRKFFFFVQTFPSATKIANSIKSVFIVNLSNI